MTYAGADLMAAPVSEGEFERPPASAGGRSPWWAWALVAGAVAWGLVALRDLTIAVPYVDDSSLHEQMVRVATAQWRAGHLPLTSWFPYLGEGSPQFLHYQSLPAMIAGAVGLITGPDVAFRWALYLLLATWPISVYLSARLFGAGRGAAAASAAMAPFLWSRPGVGYEQSAYVWVGYGVWTQLWAMWVLPLAWGASWRAIRDGRGYLRAVVLTALAACLHFETGYLALSVLIVWPFVAGRPLLVRIRRSAVLFGASLLTMAWAVLPLLAQGRWAALNEPLQGTTLVNGYGAHQVLLWLFDGEMLDHGRFPIITILAAVGFGLAWLSWSTDHDGRALLFALGICLLFAFGRTTFGSLIDIVPGASNLFFRRFMMGVQLSCLLLAGRGAGWLVARVAGLWERRVPRWPVWLSAALAAMAAIGVLAPAWTQLDRFDGGMDRDIVRQRSADATEGAEVNRLTALIRRDGGGRTYAGTPSNWGAGFSVGEVPVFKYIEGQDVDEVGYTLRTASLMTDPEYDFDGGNPSDFRLFAIHWLILPAGRRPPVPARHVTSAGRYALWTIPGDGYVDAGQIVGRLPADRNDLGARSVPLQRSDLADHGDYLRVSWGSTAAGGRLPTATSGPPAGAVVGERAALSDGRASAVVHMTRPGVAVLSASYDPGWQATVNGRRARTHFLDPAVVGVDVPAGTDRVVFTYHGFGGYPELLALAGLTLLGVGLVSRRSRTRRLS